MALYFECRINKNTLLQTVFLAILPTGLLIFLRLSIVYSGNVTTQKPGYS